MLLRNNQPELAVFQMASHIRDRGRAETGGSGNDGAARRRQVVSGQGGELGWHLQARANGRLQALVLPRHEARERRSKAMEEDKGGENTMRHLDRGVF